MLFRYKIEKRYDHICNGLDLIHYDVTIQKYNINNLLFKWTTYESTTLKKIVDLLSKKYCFTGWDNALPEILQTVSEYGSVDRMMEEYIHKFIIRNMELEDRMNDIEKSIDEIVLTNNWKTIEFKENE